MQRRAGDGLVNTLAGGSTVQQSFHTSLCTILRHLAGTQKTGKNWRDYPSASNETCHLWDRPGCLY